MLNGWKDRAEDGRTEMRMEGKVGGWKGRLECPKGRQTKWTGWMERLGCPKGRQTRGMDGWNDQWKSRRMEGQ
jgi:hypothetical protein